jgi:hypothetical protein
MGEHSANPVTLLTTTFRRNGEPTSVDLSRSTASYIMGLEGGGNLRFFFLYLFAFRHLNLFSEIADKGSFLLTCSVKKKLFPRFLSPKINRHLKIGRNCSKNFPYSSLEYVLFR